MKSETSPIWLETTWLDLDISPLVNINYDLAISYYLYHKYKVIKYFLFLLYLWQTRQFPGQVIWNWTLVKQLILSPASVFQYVKMYALDLGGTIVFMKSLPSNAMESFLTTKLICSEVRIIWNIFYFTIVGGGQRGDCAGRLEHQVWLWPRHSSGYSNLSLLTDDKMTEARSVFRTLNTVCCLSLFNAKSPSYFVKGFFVVPTSLRYIQLYLDSRYPESWIYCFIPHPDCTFITD